MGILNVTPDSFSDGGRFFSVESAVRQAHRLAEEGAHIIDVGGQSTRPGSLSISSEEEEYRVREVLLELRKTLDRRVLISLDTSSPRVAERCAERGTVDVLNDVFAGTRTEAGCDFFTIDVAKRFQLGFVAMHAQGTPATMQVKPEYNNCVLEVCNYLRDRAERICESGVDSLCLDPGIGFGKSTEHNLDLLSYEGMTALVSLNFPILIGLSRKRFLVDVARQRGAELPGNPEARDCLSKELELRSIQFGAKIIRTHTMPNDFQRKTANDLASRYVEQSSRTV